MNVGDIVLQKPSFDLKTAAIGLHQLMLGKIVHYVHCGIYAGDGEMYTSSGHVRLQDAGAANSIAIPHKWNDWAAAEFFLKAQLGKPYDWAGWGLAAVEPFLIPFGFHRPLINHQAYTCSSLVAAALVLDGMDATTLIYRTVTPDDVAKVL